MTIINPNSISGISSITALNSTAAINLFKSDGTAANIIAGVTTGTNFKTGSSNLHNVGIEIAGINVLGADTPIGAGATIYNSGAAVFTGIVTATNLDIEGGSAALSQLKINSTGRYRGIQLDENGTRKAHFQHDATSNTTVVGTAEGTMQFNSGDTPRVVLNSSGHWVPYADSTYDLGLTGTRWRNVYADTLYGSGANLTNLPAQATIANNADNRIITGGSGVNLNGESTLTFNGTSLSLGAHRDIRFTNGNWTGEYAGKIQFHDNRLYFQSGSNGWNFRNSSGTTIIDITAAGAISGQPLTLAQNLTLNNVTTIGVGRDLRFSQGNWTGEVAGKIQFHSNNLYFQGGTGGHYFRNPSGVNVLIIDVDGDISTNNAPIKFDSDCLFNGGSDAVEIAANGDIKLNNGTWSGEKTYKIQAHSSTMYLQAPAFIFRDDSGSNRWAINSSGHFNPSTNNTYDIGSSSFKVKDIYAAGNLNINGNVVVATAGQGIDFSARGNTGAMTSELLDHYEEGTWTPSFYPMSSNIPVTYNIRAGQYTRIGNVVYWQFKIQVSNITGNRNQGFGISGFPYNINNTHTQCSGEFYGETWDGEIPTTIKYISNTTRGVCYYYADAMKYYASSMLDINVSSSVLLGSGHYFV